MQPIDKYLDFEKYRSKIVPYAITGMTYQGKPYGLPYYADIASFVWNPTVAKKYGVDHAPTSWDEPMSMAQSMKAHGVPPSRSIWMPSGASPLRMASTRTGGITWAWTSMTLSAAGASLLTVRLPLLPR